MNVNYCCSCNIRVGNLCTNVTVEGLGAIAFFLDDKEIPSFL